MEPRQTEGIQEPALSKEKEVITLFFHDDLCLQDGVVKGKVGHGNLHLHCKVSYMSWVGRGTCPLTSVPAMGPHCLPKASWHCKRRRWQLREFPTAGESPARGWAAGEGGAGSHPNPGLEEMEESQVWQRGIGWGCGGKSFCLDGKLSENPELPFQFRLPYWFVLFLRRCLCL